MNDKILIVDDEEYIKGLPEDLSEWTLSVYHSVFSSKSIGKGNAYKSFGGYIRSEDAGDGRFGILGKN